MKKASSEAWSTAFRRLAMAVIALCLTTGASYMFAIVVQSDGFDWLDIVRIALMAVASFWLAWGGCIALFGILFPPEERATAEALPDGRTAVLLPIYNEATGPVFARLEAIMKSVAALPAADRFDFSSCPTPPRRMSARKNNVPMSDCLFARTPVAACSIGGAKRTSAARQATLPTS